ncbi:hypothetical protein ACWNT8_10415 [Pigmentibacter ruber]
MLMKKKFNKLFFLTLLIIISSSSCQKENSEKNNKDNLVTNNENWKNTSLDKELPRSSYLSNQRFEYPKPAVVTDKSNPPGYDDEYMMINYRPLDNVTPNPPDGSLNHVIGLRINGLPIRIPLNKYGFEEDLIDSKNLIDNFLQYVEDPKNDFERVEDKILAFRNAIHKVRPQQPRVLISGLGPTGLLSLLEAYKNGASVIGVERRSQYTRPQVLRLTDDTIKNIKYFLGDKLFEHLREVGVISRSPNWIYNKFDKNNKYIYKPGVPFNLTPSDRAFQAAHPELKMENVDIIRINHLETILAAVVEHLAKVDSHHIRVYYGSVLDINKNPSSVYDLTLKVFSVGLNSSAKINPDVMLVSEGNTDKAKDVFDIARNDLKTETLYGATVAFRLPVGFDISLRPIENFYGTASVKGIAQIDEDKLTKVGNDIENYKWTMIDEQVLCVELNKQLDESLKIYKSITPKPKEKIEETDINFPCNPIATIPLLPPLSRRNGGDRIFLPRTRYFFTGGIAYLGAELQEKQYKMYHEIEKYIENKNKTKVIKENTKQELKKIMLILAKKHMPREYIEGQDPIPYKSIADRALGNSSILADISRVIMVAEENTSLGLFPIILKRAVSFNKPVKIKDKVGNEKTMRVFVMGDSYATTHFFTGSGAVNGLRGASFFATAMYEGCTDISCVTAAKKISDTTDEMHAKVIEGKGDAPLDGPFNQRIP